MIKTVMPEPLRFDILSEESVFRVSSFMKIVGEENTLFARDELLFFLNDCLEVTPIGGKEEIRFILDENPDAKKGSYKIRSEKDKLTLYAENPEGLFYAVQTLKQILFEKRDSLPAFEIDDEPLFESRGFMLDCGRYFFTKEAVLHFIDLMAVYKLNEFHWHLSDDQGFRCELDSAPLLTHIGAYRSHTNFNAKEHGGYYTKKDIKEITDYAHSKYIKVIPEIDTPGHSVSMISSYPSLSCFEREIPVATHWGIKHDVLCPGKDSTFRFMFKLLDELCEMFPDGTVHIGGDEVPVTRWKLCPHCQKRMKQEGFTDESELHAYYLNRIGRYLLDKGVEVRMWNDKKREKGVDSSLCWQLWNDDMTEQDIKEEIGKGRSFILSNSSAYYLDLPYGQVSLEKTYESEPIFYRLDERDRNKIKGMEACLWTEFVPDIAKADYQTLPRLAAFSENVWTKKEKKSYDRFCKKLDSHSRYLRFNGFLPADRKKADPKGLRKAASLLYWERRRFCWGDVGNFFDNAAVKRKYDKEKRNCNDKPDSEA